MHMRGQRLTLFKTTCWIGYDLISFILALSIADITLIRDRGWIFGLSSVPQLVNTYVGPLVAQSLQKGDHWRSTYGISACVLPLVSLPLSATLFDDSHKLAQATTQPIQSSVEETKPKLGWKRVLTVMKRVLVQDDCKGKFTSTWYEVTDVKNSSRLPSHSLMRGNGAVAHLARRVLSQAFKSSSSYY